jgi:hypothetical protein
MDSLDDATIAELFAAEYGWSPSEYAELSDKQIVIYLEKLIERKALTHTTQTSPNPEPLMVQAKAPGEPSSSPSSTCNESNPRMSKTDANEKAKVLAKRYGRAFFQMSKRKQAELIGCHCRTWAATDLYRSAVKKGLVSPSKTRSPKTVSFTSEQEKVTGEGERDEVLRQLLAECAADNEPSPLDHDPPGRSRKVHAHKRL